MIENNKKAQQEVLLDLKHIIIFMGIAESFKKIFSGKGKSYLKCNLCNKTLPNEAEFDNHMKTAHK
jgi:hypothetical protein